jgi:hypothetical protein
MRLFGRSREERERAAEVREQEAREWLDAHNAEKQARAEARAAQASGGGITHSGPGELNITGQAFGQGTEVRNVEAGSEGPGGPGRGGPGRAPEAHRGHEGPYIVSTGSGTINVANSAVGNGIHLVNYAEPAAPAAGQELEAGS